MKKLVALFGVTAVAALGLAACGSDDDSDTTAADTADTTTANTTEPATPPAGQGEVGGDIRISAPADGSFKFDQSEIDATAGTNTVSFDNAAALSHDVVIEDSSGTTVGETDLVSEGDASTDVDLTPGTYTFYCDVPGHREGGMEGTITVK